MMRLFSKMNRALRRNVLFGLFIVTPVGVTILIANWLFQIVTGLFLPRRILEDSTNELLLRLGALVITLLALCLIGFLVRSFFGRKLYQFGERALAKIPIINRIYLWVRQISETLVAQRDTMFKEVVLFEYPRRGLYSIGFVTSRAPGQFPLPADPDPPPREWISLFVPTTPNPTSGYYILAARDDVQTLPISIPEAMQLIISAGAVHPGRAAHSHQPDLFEKLEQWLARDHHPDPPQAKEAEHE